MSELKRHSSAGNLVFEPGQNYMILLVKEELGMLECWNAEKMALNT